VAKTVLVASDHRGFDLKAQVIAWLAQHDYKGKDLGTHSDARCDAVDFAKKMADEFTVGGADFGVLICGSGQAMAMTANRYRNLRAALCVNSDVARLAREHNDANVLAIGADFTSSDMALQCLETFLKTSFLGGRYAERRDKLTQLGGL
jgi:ribose 5-phosphate isomerase B